MNKTCDICHKDASYKCPTCFVFYCSLTCCKKHREAKCDVVKFDSDEDDDEQLEKKRKVDKGDYASNDKTETPKNSDQSNGLLSTNHSRNLPVTIDEAEKVEEILEKTETQPVFKEMAAICLKVIEPQIEDNEPQINEETYQD